MNNIDEAHCFDENNTFFTYSKQISMSLDLLLNKWIALIVFRGLHFVVLVSNKEIWFNNLFHKLKYTSRSQIEDKFHYQKFYTHLFY